MTAQRGRLPMVFCASLLIALLVCASAVYAQSGRRNTSAQQPAPVIVRPRNVNTPQQNKTAAPKPQPTQTRERVPASTDALGEPPPMPTPKPTPTPAQPPASKAAANEGDEVDAEDVVRINSNLVTVPASVIDARGKAVTDLKLEDFELRIDGQQKPITELGFADSPVRMALLFDNSSSLIAAREFEKQAAVRFFRSVLRPADQAMIYSVSTVPTLAQPLTSDVQMLVRTIERFPKPEGATALFDAIAEAAAYLKPHLEGRRVIVIVSDGADTISDLDFESALRRAQASDCQIYAVQTGYVENANLRDLAAERRLLELAAQTGGAVYIPRSTSDLDTAFAQIAADLAQQYVLSYYPNDDKNDGRFRTITVRVVTRPNLRVRARKGYYAMPGQKQAWLPAVTPQPGPQSQTQSMTGNQLPGGVDQNSASANVIAANLSNLTANSIAQDTAPTTGSLYAGTDTRSAPRERVGPRGPSDDSVGPGDSREASSTKINASPPPASSAQTSPASSTVNNSPSPSNTTQLPAQPESSANTKPATPATETDSGAKESKSEAKESKPEAKDSKPAGPKDAKPEAKQTISGGVLNGKALDLPKPLYPPAAKSMGASGLVVVEVLVDESGKVISAHALSGHLLLQGPCITAARKAKFSPTMISGQPVQVKGLITYNFAQ